MTDRKRVKIGVMGSASGPTIRDEEIQDRAYRLGQAIARNDCILVNGACPGLPDRAAAGARAEGGFVLGVSPAFSKREHLEIYGSPVEHYDLIIYSGMGFNERDVVNIRSSDAVVIVGGGIGTLNEFTVAYGEHKPIGVLTATGGISDHIPEIMDFCHRPAGPDRIIFDDEPESLIERLLAFEAKHPDPLRISDISGEKDEAQRLQQEAIRRQQRMDHDRGKRTRDEDETA